jgi:NitT/TauT family transport system substrate-binding protein
MLNKICTRLFPRLVFSCLLSLGILSTTVSVAEAKEKVEMAGLTWPGYGFWFIVNEKNLAPDLDITFKTIEDPYQSFNLLVSGRLDVVSSTVEFTPIAAAQKMPFKQVAFGNLSIGTDKIIFSPQIKKPSDLKGQDVAVLEGGLSQLFVGIYLEQNGMSHDDVNYVNIIADDAFAAQISGNIAASEYWEPYGSNVLRALPGSTLAASTNDDYWKKSALVADGYYMSDDFLTNRRDTSVKVMKALYDAIDWWSKNPEEGNKIIAKGFKMSVDDVEMILGTDGTRKDGGLYPYTFIEAARFCGVAEGRPPFGQENGQVHQHWDLISEWWVKFGLMKETLPSSKGVDCGILSELLEQGYGQNLALK